LLEGFVRLLGQWDGVFCQYRSLWKAQRHALGLVLTLGTVQISWVLCTLGLAGRDWSVEHRQFSRSNWDEQTRVATFDRPCRLVSGPGLIDQSDGYP